LLVWAGASTLVGAALVVFTAGFWNGFGIQALAWGTIDGLIAGFGLWMSTRRRRRLTDSEDPQRKESESRKLRRTLWINTCLDLVYIAGGVVLAATLGKDTAAWRGHGWGIIVQGAFLLFFDLIHAQSVPPGLVSQPLAVFTDPIHQPFLLSGRSGAALLVHGFPGTPAEMRPLAETLHEQGWTVQGILLPGFGSRFAEILQRGHDDWLESVVETLETLKKKYSPVLLVGYSLGGALCLGAAVRSRPDGLVLVSPFWRLGTPLQRLVGRTLRPFLPRYFRPLRKADLRDQKLRHSLQDFFPDVDLGDPAVQSWLRDLQVPLSVIDQIMKTGTRGYRSAGLISNPTLVVQGAEDELVLPRNTQVLVERLTSADGSVAGGTERRNIGGVRYLEIPGGHNIIDEHEPSWTRLEQGLIEFSRFVRDGEGNRA
jgi:carboxylesterase